MTRAEAIKWLEYHKQGEMGKAVEALDMVIKALEQEPKISLDTYKQVTKERDIAIEQLHELGYEFGEKIEPTTKNNLGVDCISRKAAEDITWQDPSYTDPLNILTEVRDKIRELPSVTPQLSVPEATALAEWIEKLTKASEDAYNKGYADGMKAQEPKTGHWVKTPKAVMGEGYMWYCDRCEHEVYSDSSRPYPSQKYCPNCGAKMVEPQESEK